MTADTVLVVYGTRPEVIKMAPVVAALRNRPQRFRVTLCSTAQHREMLDQAQEAFGLTADIDLALMRPDQTLNGLAARIVSGVDEVLSRISPAWVLVQGDTTTALCGAMAAFHRRIRIGHVEAGLRTGDLGNPFPEEMNRRVIAVVADALFAPTLTARENLLAEGVDPAKIHVTGNTIVDALRVVGNQLPTARAAPAVLITIHRRESFGAPLLEILGAVRELAESFPLVHWVYPVHLNPNVRCLARTVLSGLPNLALHEPFDYHELVWWLRSARLVLTDSGGIQEEALTLGKPVLVLREATERPEGLDCGMARLVGTSRKRIVAAFRSWLSEQAQGDVQYPEMNLYGDGHAGDRIAAILAGERVSASTWCGPLG